MKKRWLGCSLWLISGVLGFYVLYLPPAANSAWGQQAFDAAATVTALVQTREAILVLLTRTPVTQAVSSAQSATTAATSATVTINVRGLNVRSGPGTTYPVVASVNAGQILTILGSAANCSWIQVQAAGQELGWISGSAQYVTMTVPCSALAQTAPNAPPPPTPTAAPATPVVAAADGCYVLSNQLGFDLTITLSRADGWRASFSLAANAEREYCAPAGDYQYTLQAPGSLGAIQGTLTIKAGERYQLPLRLGE
ncbi:MAG: SH3 domain-containing protein [Caldilineaceae bacterium]|nr:SH3 domain-containing protein [Caldilineaceae bacterium]